MSASAARRANDDARSLGDGRCDAEALGDVVDHEADDEEAAERELAEGERRADGEPLAEVVDADADGHERGERDAAEHALAPSRPPSQPLGDERQREVAAGDAEQHEPGAAQLPGQRGLQLERLGQRLEGEERQQAGRERHEGGQPAGIRAAQRGEPHEPERDGHDADEEADQRVAEHALRVRFGRPHGGGDLLRHLDPARARDADGDRLVLDPVVRDDDRRRAQPLERRRPVDRVRHDRVGDRHRADGDGVALRVRHPDLDPARLERHAADVELVGGRRVRARRGRRSSRRPWRRATRRRRGAGSAAGPTAASRGDCPWRRRPPPTPRPRRSPSSRARRTPTGARGT